MATFKSERMFTSNSTNLNAVATFTKDYFENKGYQVAVEENALGYLISISKGGMFKAVLGMKTALNIEIKKLSSGIFAEAKVGIFGQQLIPSMITLFVAWPILVTQISGLVSQSKLDDEAMDVIEQAIRSQERNTAPAFTQSHGATIFCTSCGNSIKPDARFCSSCGAKQ